MNIIFLVNRDIAGNFALNHLLPQLSEHKVSLFLSERVGKPGSMSEHRQSLAFFEQTLFNQLVTPLLNQRESYSNFKTFEQMAPLLVQPPKVMNDINSSENLREIESLKPDLIISIRYGCILKQPAIDVPRFGVLNLHSGLLPEYRGVMATFWAMMNDEPTIGTTLHYIDNAKIDQGPVVSRAPVSMNPSDSYLMNVLNLYKPGCDLILKSIDQLSHHGSLDTLPQNLSGAYYTFPTEEQWAMFSDKGLRLVEEDKLTDFIKEYYLDDLKEDFKVSSR
ncbi:formyl transferase [Pleionea sediminis]|uniref:formyl transferase n=1 Tax=Pleionea sediminis TaxID=2569479 RepID=UPI0011856CDC|nr:formyl transferase [Pleionea sediminis]